MQYTVFTLGAIASAVLSSAMSIAGAMRAIISRRHHQGTTPISVLKPVKGLDDELEANLESFCLQTHPCYEVLVGAADADDPALRVAARVKRRFPHVAFRIVHGQHATGCNPKVRNLRNLLAHARYPTVLVSDGDIRVPRDYLKVMAGAIERPGTGLVSNLVLGTGEQTIGAACENLHLNGFTAMSIAAAEMYVRHPIVMGKSMLFRRDALTSAGGFEAAANVLAEDYLLGKAVRDSGYRVRTIGYPVWAINRNWTMSKMLHRHVRWAQIRRYVSPISYFFEPLALPELWLVPILACWWLLPHYIDRHTTSIVTLLLSGAIALQVAVSASLQGSRFRVASLVWLPLSSVMALVAWVRAWTLNVVIWRNQSYRIGAGSRLSVLAAQRLEPSRAAHVQEAA